MDQRGGIHAAAGGAGGSEGVQPHYWAQRTSHGGRVPAISTKDAANVPSQHELGLVSTPAAAAAVLAGLHRQEYTVGEGLFLAAVPPADLVLTCEPESAAGAGGSGLPSSSTASTASSSSASSASSADADALAFGAAGLVSYPQSSLRRLPARTIATVPFRVQLPGTPRAAVERMRRLEREYLAQALRSGIGGGAGTAAGGGGSGGITSGSISSGSGSGGSSGVLGGTALEDVLCRIQCWAVEDVASPAVDRARSAASGNFGGSLEVDASAAGAVAAAGAARLQGALLSLMPGEEVDALARVSPDAAAAAAGASDGGAASASASSGGGGSERKASSYTSLASLTGAAQLYAALASSGPLVGTQHSQMQRYVLVRRARDGRVGFVPLQALSLGSAPVALSSALPGVTSHGRP